MIAETVGKIEKLISEAGACQKPYVTRICPSCKFPCCLRVHYLYNDKDIIFLKASGRPPKWRRKAFSKKGCRFLRKLGCTLDYFSRPFLCHTYLCEELKDAMDKDNPAIIVALENRFGKINELRSRLWSEYLDEQGGKKERPGKLNHP
ncbi:MAG: hypothetical protein U5R49_16845 [Deltaproteobacteria bacterium]|nr:hypothetical protein [Deltaproteobacteria bacterium]